MGNSHPKNLTCNPIRRSTSPYSIRVAIDSSPLRRVDDRPWASDYLESVEKLIELKEEKKGYAHRQGIMKPPPFSRNGKLLVTTSLDDTARVWEVETGTLLNDLKGDTPDQGHTADVLSASFDDSGKYVATSTLTGR